MDLKSLPKKVLDLFPRWSYQCPNCGKQYPEAVQVCTQCGTPYNESKWRVPPRFLKDYDTMSEYAHKVLAPKLDSEQRELLFQYFTEFLNDGFESGDFSAWNGTGGHSEPSVSSSYSHQGTYSAMFDPATWQEEYVTKTFSAQTTLHVRAYYYFNSSVPNNTGNWIMRGFDSSPYTQIFALTINPTTIRITDVLNTTDYDASVTFNGDTWYCLEAKIVVNSSDSAELRVWVDGIEEITQTGLNITTAEIDRIDLGYKDYGGNNDIYIDSVVIADTYIGPDPLFEDDFETDTLGKWTGSGGSPDVQDSVAHHGTYAVQFDANGESCYKNLPSDYTEVYARAYIYFNSLPATGELAYICTFMKDGSYRMRTGVYNNNGTMQIVITDIEWITSNYAFNTGQWYCWEIKWDSDADDYGVFINDKREITSSATSSDDVNRVNLGFIGGWTNQDIIADCVVVDDEYVGPEVPDLPFSDDFESGDFSAWTRTNESPTVVGTPVHHGSYAMECNTIYEYASISLDDPTLVYARCYLRVESLPAAGNHERFIITGTPNYMGVYIGIHNNSGTYQWRFFDGTNTQYITADISTNTWYCAEIMSDADTNNAEVWINGNSIATGNGTFLASYTTSVMFGACYRYGGGSWNTYIDCAVVSDTYIGPETELPFSDDFESGTFSEWTDTTTNGGSSISASSDVAKDGSYSAKATALEQVDDWAFVYKSLSEPEAYMRYYVRMPVVFDANAAQNLGGFYHSSAWLAYVVRNQSTGKWGIYNVVTSTITYESGTTDMSADTWYCIELHASVSPSAGVLQLWIDGVLKVDLSGQNTGSNNIELAAVGCGLDSNESASRTVYSDSVVVAETYIGPETELSFSDGFESGNFSAWTDTSGSPSVQGAVTHQGNNAMLSTENGDIAYFEYDATDTVYLRAYVRMTVFTTGVCRFLEIRSGQYIWAVQAEVNNATGNLYLRRVAPSTQSIDSEEVLDVDTWYCVEISWHRHASTGWNKLWLDGELVVDDSDVDTASGTADSERVVVGQCYSNMTTDVYIDSVITDHTYIEPEEESPQGVEADFETGDTSEFDDTTTDNGTLMATDTASHHGSYSCKCDVNADGGAYAEGYFGIEAQQPVYCRGYFRFNQLPETNKDYTIISFENTSGPSTVGYVQLIDDNGTKKWKMMRDTGSATYSTSISKIPEVDAWVCVEFAHGDNLAKLWIDGEELLTHSDASDQTINRVHIGACIVDIDADDTLEIYVDCIIVANEYVGPEAPDLEVSNLTVNKILSISGTQLYTAEPNTLSLANGNEMTFYNLIESKQNMPHYNFAEFIEYMDNDEALIPDTTSKIRFYDLGTGHNFCDMFGLILTQPVVAPFLATSHHLAVKKDAFIKGQVVSLEGCVTLYGGHTDWAPSNNPLIWLAEGGIYGNNETLEIRFVTNSGPPMDWGYGGLNCGNLILSEQNDSGFVDVRPVMVDTNPILHIDQSVMGIKNISCQGFLGSESATRLTFNALDYQECIPSDIGKPVEDDGIVLPYTVLADYDNETRIWWLSKPHSVATGSEMKIVNGTGEGNTSSSSEATGGGAIQLGQGFEREDDPPRINLTDSGDHTLYITSGSSIPNGADSILANMKLNDLTANEHIHLNDSSSLITRQQLLDHLYKVGQTPDEFNWATIPQYLRFYNQTTGISAYMFCPSLSDGYNEPVLYWNRALAVRKDIITGGRLDSMEGVVSLLGGVGWGPDGYNSNPFIWLVGNQHGYPDKDTLEIRTSTYSGGWIWGWGNIAAGEVTANQMKIRSTNNVFSVAAGDNGLNQDTYLIPLNPSEGGLGLGTLAYPFKWVDATTVLTDGINGLTEDNDLVITPADEHKVVVDGDLEVTGNIIGQVTQGGEKGSDTTGVNGQATINFSESFVSTPLIFVQSTDSSARAVRIDVISKSASGFTVKATINADHKHQIGRADGSSYYAPTVSDNYGHGHSASLNVSSTETTSISLPSPTPSTVGGTTGYVDTWGTWNAGADTTNHTHNFGGAGAACDLAHSHGTHSHTISQSVTVNSGGSHGHTIGNWPSQSRSLYLRDINGNSYTVGIVFNVNAKSAEDLYSEETALTAEDVVVTFDWLAVPA